MKRKCFGSDLVFSYINILLLLPTSSANYFEVEQRQTSQFYIRKLEIGVN